MTDEDEPVVRLVRWTGPWADDDPDANLKADVALYSRLDPLKTLNGLSTNVGLPVGALARYVLARYATSGSGGLLAAYDQLRQMLEWLRFPLVHPEAYEQPE